MTAARAVTPLAIDAFGKRACVSRFGERLLVTGGDLWIGVVAEHAIVRDGAAEAIVVRTVVTGIHRPVAALLRVPAQRQFEQRVRAGPVEIRPRVVPGAHDVVD